MVTVRAYLPSLLRVFLMTAVMLLRAYGLDFPDRHNMDPVATALLGTGQEPWKYGALVVTADIGRFIEGVEGFLARSTTLKVADEPGGTEVLFAAVEAEPIGPNYGDGWNRVIRCGMVKKRGEQYERALPRDATSWLFLPRPAWREDGGYFHVGGLAHREVDGKRLVCLTYSYAESISTPHGWHEITVFIDCNTPEHRPKIVWYGETGYSLSGGGVGHIEEKTSLEFRDIDGDGHTDIEATTARTESRVYLWKNDGFATGR